MKKFILIIISVGQLALSYMFAYSYDLVSSALQGWHFVASSFLGIGGLTLLAFTVITEFLDLDKY